MRLIWQSIKSMFFLFNIDNIPLGKIPSGCQKSIFNCHTVFLTSDCFEEDCEFIDINPDYKKNYRGSQEFI